MSKPKMETWVSASDIGRAEFCGKYLELRESGAKVGDHAIAKRKQGERGHDELNKRVADNRCYVATHLYGPNDDRTHALRQFRDRYLLTTFAGRMFVAVYYSCSPAFVGLSRTFPVLDRISKPVIDRIATRALREKTS